MATGDDPFEGSEFIVLGFDLTTTGHGGPMRPLNSFIRMGKAFATVGPPRFSPPTPLISQELHAGPQARQSSQSFWPELFRRLRRV